MWQRKQRNDSGYGTSSSARGRRRRRRRRRKIYSRLTQEEEEEVLLEEETKGLFKAEAMNEKVFERDRATPA